MERSKPSVRAVFSQKLWQVCFSFEFSPQGYIMLIALTIASSNTIQNATSLYLVGAAYDFHKAADRLIMYAICIHYDNSLLEVYLHVDVLFIHFVY